MFIRSRNLTFSIIKWKFLSKGTIGVAAVTAGPGLTNTITAVKNAQMAERPILLLGGAAANLLKGRGALQGSLLLEYNLIFQIY